MRTLLALGTTLFFVLIGTLSDQDFNGFDSVTMYFVCLILFKKDPPNDKMSLKKGD